ncbi:DUF423 domain-containing protein [Oecophyllibacter saccharovorans]|nr:DUF423 domain-containing protein [Oecophyllibacter saccharovorans]
MEFHPMSPHLSQALTAPSRPNVIHSILRGSFIFGALLSAGGLISAALAAHLPAHFFVPAVPPSLPDGRHMLATAAGMAQWQGAALCLLALAASRLRPLPALCALIGMEGGALMFCGTVTLRAFALPCVPLLAPVGGMGLILSWILLGFAFPGRKQWLDSQNAQEQKKL